MLNLVLIPKLALITTFPWSKNWCGRPRPNLESQIKDKRKSPALAAIPRRRMHYLSLKKCILTHESWQLVCQIIYDFLKPHKYIQRLSQVQMYIWSPELVLCFSSYHFSLPRKGIIKEGRQNTLPARTSQELDHNLLSLWRHGSVEWKVDKESDHKGVEAMQYFIEASQQQSVCSTQFIDREKIMELQY